MDSTTTTMTTPKPVCAQEALALLNCAVESSYDRDKCLAALDALRACIAQKDTAFIMYMQGAFIVVIQLQYL
ncbi:hypothetical protein E2562_016364 [Oryza meyeriana var. granulata]|uniref:CHCH domain-containing protein n=1 Tax=Oryza meyeriana var. granulata TaxID=110450 RepID=A0A6G1DX79_9ORYZ|nr:hypothetical protein E2562_016364 [Oryza meyeriana var. granulata]